MTSEDPEEAYVWIWLPGKTEPVVAGRAFTDGAGIAFVYGRSYLSRPDAISIYEPELPLIRGAQTPAPPLTMANCLQDAAPDAWGRRVIMHRLLGAKAATTDPAALPELAYLLLSGSDRAGAIDFQESATEYSPRGSGHASLDELVDAADRIERDLPLSPEVEQALLHGSSIGGARPKALVMDGDVCLIAKFASSGDPYPVVQGEFVAMELARRAGLSAATVRLTSAAGRAVLLVERFDRVAASDGWLRRPVVSALTMLGLHELQARYGTYVELARIVRQRFAAPRETLRELFARITFNVLVGNIDDHPRNHAAFWDGTQLTLTPAYDVCPQLRSGGEAAQLMAYAEDGARSSRVVDCIAAASTYLLGEAEARAIVEHQVEVIRSQWSEVCELAELGARGRAYFWERQFLNPWSMEGFVA